MSQPMNYRVAIQETRAGEVEYTYKPTKLAAVRLYKKLARSVRFVEVGWETKDKYSFGWDDHAPVGQYGQACEVCGHRVLKDRESIPTHGHLAQ